tara:strand:- start:304 stop:453 length:150 start_codon:yes stop_codon:yes gene_type:complete
MNVYIYRSQYYYENTLPKSALKRTLNGHNLFKIVNNTPVLIPIEGDEEE